MKSTMIVLMALVLALDHFNVVFGEPGIKRWHKIRVLNTQVNKLTSIAINNYSSYTICVTTEWVNAFMHFHSTLE